MFNPILNGSYSLFLLSLAFSSQLLKINNIQKFVLFQIIQGVIWIFFLGQRRRLNLWFLVVGTLGLFILFRSVSPQFENDFYRYFFDGLAILKYGTSYGHIPKETLIMGFETINKRIGFPHLSTLYPPITELLFALLTFISNQNLSIFLWLLVAGGSSLFSYAYHRYLSDRGTDDALKATLLFLQHPLIIKEWYNGCHYDSWFVAANCFVFSTRLLIPRAIALSLSFHIKIMGILLLFTRLIPRGSKFKSYSCIGLFLLLPILPFYSSARNWMAMVIHFGGNWEMNSGVFRWIREMIMGFYPYELARKISLVLVAIVWILIGVDILTRKYFRSDQMFFWMLFFLLLLSPVCNPWYFTWVLPFAITMQIVPKMLILFGVSVLPLNLMFYLTTPAYSVEFWWNIEHLILLSAGVVAYLEERNRLVTNIYNRLPNCRVLVRKFI